MTVVELFFRVPTRLDVVQDGATKIQEDLSLYTCNKGTDQKTNPRTRSRACISRSRLSCLDKTREGGLDENHVKP